VGKRYKIIVCRGPECGEKRHSADVHASLARDLKSCPLDGAAVQLDWHSCFGRCTSGVNVLVREVRPGENALILSLMPTSAPGAVLYSQVLPKETRRIVEEHVAKGAPVIDFTRRR
jgi:(2Fe-2S) ferredoxin